MSDHLDPQQVDRIKNVLLQAYQDQEMANVLFGDWLDKQLEVFARSIPCHEQGSAAELRRLKDWLGDKLPKDWETQRFNSIVGG